jgi:mercuric ion transport protein
MRAKEDDRSGPSRPTTLSAALSQEAAGARAGQNLMAVGGLLAALAAASCCVVPFALFLLGISGAWISNLTALEPYQPIFAAIAFGFLGYGFYLIYRKPAVICAQGSYCAEPGSKRLAKIALWAAAVLVIIALGLPKLAPLFL